MNSDKIKIVNCDKEYWEFIRDLRNHPDLKKGFINQVHITREQQLEYMNTNAPSYKVALVDGKPAGYLGIIENDIRICVAPNFQRRGVARAMLNWIRVNEPNAKARVKSDNVASLKLFKSCGYKTTFFLLEND